MAESTINALIGAYQALIKLHCMPYRTPDDEDLPSSEYLMVDVTEALLRINGELRFVLDLLEDEQLRRLSLAYPVWPGSAIAGVTDLDQAATALVRQGVHAESALEFVPPHACMVAAA